MRNETKRKSTDTKMDRSNYIVKRDNRNTNTKIETEIAGTKEIGFTYSCLSGQHYPEAFKRISNLTVLS